MTTAGISIKYKLSILIPARNEEFLAETISSILQNKNKFTEIIVILDGEVAVKPIPVHEDVTVVQLPKSIGQRAATNLAASLSKAKYVMKLDAHCTIGANFDEIMIKDMQDDWTMIPAMYNLHAFDWVCKKCSKRRYQGPSGKCEDCGGETEKDILMHAKKSPYTTAMRFDTDLRFKYWGEYKKQQQGQLVETMSILGACFMLTRKKYWELDICGEDFGSWGQQGTEVSCKTWLSGGKVIVNKNTWFSHMFRTQGGDFGFPYKHEKGAVNKARDKSKELFLEGKWKGKHSLQWLIDKFNPPGWGDNKKGLIFYTDNQLNLKIAHKVQKALKSVGLPITSTSLKPMSFGDNTVINMERGIWAYFNQIVTALEKCKQEVVFFCEHDVLYNKTHFDFIPPKKDVFYFNTNVWKVNWETGKSIWTDDLQQVSGMVCYRELALSYYRKKLEEYTVGSFDGHYEPMHNMKGRRENYQSKEPIYCIRHDNNLTKTKTKKEDFKNQKYAKGFKDTIIVLDNV